jgi:ParB family chromosome partitioning protein
MAKMQGGNSGRKISLAQIIESGNVRKDYQDIEELAQSIKTSGLLQPIAVKASGKDGDGIERYELIAGHRRLRAFKHLFDSGDGGFSMIEAVVVTGDKLTLQLVENLQRSDLTAREREDGIYLMAKNGDVPQRELAAMLGKTESYVSRNLKAHSIRDIADKEGIDTGGISTGALCEIAAAGSDIPELLKRVAEEGGSVQAARQIGREYRAETKPDELPEVAPEQELENERYNAARDALEALERMDASDVINSDSENPRKAPPARIPREEWTHTDFDVPHRDVDINSVLLPIKEYIDIAETRFTPEEAKNKRDAAYDIIALLHERLR